jgi:hypothetical protein
MCINWDIPLPEEKWPDIIYACSVVGMLMGKENGVQPVYGVAKHLLPKIRAAIDDDVMPVYLYQYGYAQALVPGIITKAHRIVTPYYGDSLRSSGSKEGYLQPLVYFIQIYNLFITWIVQSF